MNTLCFEIHRLRIRPLKLGIVCIRRRLLRKWQGGINAMVITLSRGTRTPVTPRPILQKVRFIMHTDRTIIYHEIVFSSILSEIESQTSAFNKLMSAGLLGLI